jgi:hypothetical protein
MGGLQQEPSTPLKVIVTGLTVTSPKFMSV